MVVVEWLWYGFVMIFKAFDKKCYAWLLVKKEK